MLSSECRINLNAVVDVHVESNILRSLTLELPNRAGPELG